MDIMYYSLCRMISKVKTNDNPAETAMYVIATFHGANILFVLTLLNYLIYGLRFNSSESVVLIALVMAAIVAFIDRKIFYKRTEFIEKKYRNLPVSHVRVWFIITILYGIVSFVAVYCVSNI